MKNAMESMKSRYDQNKESVNSKTSYLKLPTKRRKTKKNEKQ